MSALLPGPVGGHLTARVPTCRPEETVGCVRERLHTEAYDAVDDVAVCVPQGERQALVGLVTLRRLLTADPETLVGALMDPDPPMLVEGGDQEAAVWTAVHHGESSLAVVDEHGGFRGLVPPTRLLAVLLGVHDQDLERLHGYLETTKTARVASDEPVRARLRHRFPWLVLGLAGAALSAWIVGLFEGRLEADVRLAFFMPGVVYLADAVGTQTEAVMVRGLSVGASARRGLRLETLTGPAMGLVLAAFSFPAVWLALGDTALALTVAVALFAASSVATVLAAGLPVLVARAGKDPAFASGPLATVLQDLLSLVIYLLAAVLIL